MAENELNIENTYVETNETYKQGCALSEYRGEYSITSANVGKDGKTYKQWVFPQVSKDTPGEKALPWQVKLGDIDQAKKIWRHYLNLLEGGEAGSDDDVPF